MSYQPLRQIFQTGDQLGRSTVVEEGGRTVSGDQGHAEITQHGEADFLHHDVAGKWHILQKRQTGEIAEHQRDEQAAPEWEGHANAEETLGAAARLIAL